MTLEKELEKLEQEIINQYNKVKDKIYPCLKPIDTETEFEVEHEGKKIKIELPHIPFLGNTSVYFVIDDGEVFQLVQKRMLPYGTKIDDLLQISLKNLVRDYKFQLFEADYGGYALQSSPDHTSSYILFQPLWNKLANEHFNDNLIISVPARDVILFVSESDKVGIENLKETAKKVYGNNFKELTLALFCFDKDTGKLSEWNKKC